MDVVPAGADEGLTLTTKAPDVPVPLIGMDCVEPAIPRLLSVAVEDPEIKPDLVGTKLKISVQLAPAASCPVVVEEEFTWGQVELALRTKLDEIVGLAPAAGIVNRSGLLPLFAMVTVCGLSLLLTPTGDEAKVRLGGV